LLPTIVQPWERVEKQKGARVAMEIAAALFSLATPNLPRLLRFYQALLGIPPQVRVPPQGDPVYGEFRLPGLRLGLYHSREPELAVPGGAASLCLQVRDLAGYLGSLAAVLAEYQISPSPLRQAFHGQEVELRDPDGNRIVLHQPSAPFWEAMALGSIPQESWS
jgi:catechol 2,3-dioxygenase-like lactoylglutathione lyase family enzyme